MPTLVLCVCVFTAVISFCRSGGQHGQAPWPWYAPLHVPTQQTAIVASNSAHEEAQHFAPEEGGEATVPKVV